MPELSPNDLRRHMDAYLKASPESDGPKVVPLRKLLEPCSIEPSSTLALIEEAAETIAATNRFTAERLARADSLAKQAIQQLTDAEERIDKAESERAAAEAELDGVRLRLEQDYAAKLLKLEKLRADADARVASAEERLEEAFRRARLSEERVRAIEGTFTRIEEAIATKLLGGARSLSASSGRAA
jgi:primosomal protein N''